MSKHLENILTCNICQKQCIYSKCCRCLYKERKETRKDSFRPFDPTDKDDKIEIYFNGIGYQQFSRSYDDLPEYIGFCSLCAPFDHGKFTRDLKKLAVKRNLEELSTRKKKVKELKKNNKKILKEERGQREQITFKERLLKCLCVF